MAEEKPLNTCKDCNAQECIKTGKICKIVEKLLPKVRSGGHRKESCRSNDLLDHITTEMKLDGVWRPNLFGTQKKGELKVPLPRKLG